MEKDDLVDSQTQVMKNILNSGDLIGLREFTQTNGFLDLLSRKGNELIHTISDLLNAKPLFKSTEIIACYEEILRVVVENVNPIDSYVSLLEQFDEEISPIEKSILFLPPFTVSLQKLDDTHRFWLECGLSSIQHYLETLSPPEDHQPDDDEKILIKDPYLDSVIALYKALLSFYEAVADHCLSECEKGAVIVFGLRILTKPAMYVYVEKFEGMQRFQTRTIDCINKLSPNFHFSLSYLDEECLSNVDAAEMEVLKDEAVKERCKIWDRISPLNLAAYYCARINESNFLQYFPQVYERLYLFHKLLLLCLILLRHSHNAIARKGLHLGARLLGSMTPTSVPHHYLKYRVHREFIEVVSKISRYSNIYENRQEAFQLLQPYIRLFDARGRYMILMNISMLTDNLDIDGEIITGFRNDWRLNYAAGTLEFYQKGKHLIDLLRSFCTLPNLADTNLMEHKSKILATLYLFALLLKQDAAKNLTGVCDHFDYFEKNYFSVLAEAVKKSHREFSEQMRYLKGDCSNNAEREEISVDFEVDGQQLPPLRPEDKIEAIGSALTVLDMIEYALKLLYEYANRDML